MWWNLMGQKGPNEDGSVGYKDFSEHMANTVKASVDQVSKGYGNEEALEAYKSYITHALKPITEKPESLNSETVAVGLTELQEARHKLISKF